MKIVAFVLSITLAGHGFSADPSAKQPSSKAVTRAEKLKSGVKEFSFSLIFLSKQEDKPYYGLTLSVRQLNPVRDKPFYLSAKISEPQAARLIDHLAVDGLLENAQDLTASLKPQRLTRPGYTLMAQTDRSILESDLGWGLPMLSRLDALRRILDGDAAKKMDLLLGRLAGHRKEWQKEEAKSKPGTDNAR